jgi:hypothetical protein
MAYVTKDGGGNVTAVYGCPQPDTLDKDGNIICHGVATTYLDDADPLIAAFKSARHQTYDFSDVDNVNKELKALALCVAQVGGLTVPQIKAMFKNKWDSLP